jgi:hypothetical protein
VGEKRLSADYHQQYLAKNPDWYCGIGGRGAPFKVAELQVGRRRSDCVDLVSIRKPNNFQRKMRLSVGKRGGVYLRTLLIHGAHSCPAQP